MELLQLKCPVCHSADIKYHSPYTIKNHGSRVMYKCATCPACFSETKNTLLEGLKTPVSVIWHVLKARTEGMGLNAAARTFDKAKNTILAWEQKFVDLHRVLLLYALVHEFLASVIEGDEAYTKVQKNVPPDGPACAFEPICSAAHIGSNAHAGPRSVTRMDSIAHGSS